MEALAQVLEATLSPDGNVRIKAELELRQIYYNRPDTGAALVQLLLNPSVPLPLRQSATTTLDKYVLATWSLGNKEFVGMEYEGGRRMALPEEAKGVVRKGVWEGLESPEGKIRSGCAKLVSNIAHTDYPDAWPNLPQQLLTLLSSPNATSVHGALRVLNDFVGADLSEDQLIPLARDMLPRLQDIFQTRQVHSPSTRARAVLIFRQCVETLFMVKDNHPQAVQTAVSEILPRWLSSFEAFLQAREPGEEVIVGAVSKTLDTIQTCFAKSLTPHLQPLLWSGISTLASLYPYYRALYLNTSLPQPNLPPTEEEMESSDLSSDLENTIANCLDWLCNSTKRKPAKKILIENKLPKKELETLIALTLQYGKMSEEKEEEWANDASAMIADEEDELAKFDVRLAAMDLLSVLRDAYEIETAHALWTAIQQVTAESEAQRQAGEKDWWKGYEAVLNATASISAELIDFLSENGEAANFFNIGSLFDGIVFPNLPNIQHPFLQGRAFVFASQFSSVLPPGVAERYVEAAMEVLQKPDASVPVKISSVRAVKNFSKLLPPGAMNIKNVRIIKDLAPLLAQTTDNVTVLLIETLQAAVSAGGELLDEETAEVMSDAVLHAWGSHFQDPILTAAVGDFFGSVAATSTPLANQLLVALHLGSENFAIGEGFFNPWAGPVLKLLLTSEDPDIMMEGLKALTSMVRKDVQQIVNWRDESHTGLDYIFQIVSRSLSGSGGFSNESGGMYVGDLVVHLLRKASQAVLPILPDLLTAFVKRLGTATTVSFIQSLILPFAFLIQAGEMDTVLNLLEGVTVTTTDGSQKNGLEVLLTTWIDNYGYFQGYWNIKVSTVALSKLLVAQRPSLNNVIVKGDRIITAQNANVIMTRSRARQNPDQYTMIPFPIKCVKVLLHELQSAGDDAVITSKNETVDSEINSDDGDDDWEEEDDPTVKDSDLQLLSDFLSGAVAGDDAPFDTQESDQDLKDDPIYNVDVQQHVAAVLKEMNAQCGPSGLEGTIGGALAEEEKDVLRKVMAA
ncbi:ARM repeat-containing protein [Atractiella rhizophila]|nr:ARM repeat-containing protein [Atractiella rhizophila]